MTVIILIVVAITTTLLLVVALNVIDRLVRFQEREAEAWRQMVSAPRDQGSEPRTEAPPLRTPWFVPTWWTRPGWEAPEPEESHIPVSFGPDHDDWSEPALPQAPVLAAKSKLRELDEEPGILPKPEPPARP